MIALVILGFIAVWTSVAGLAALWIGRVIKQADREQAAGQAHRARTDKTLAQGCVETASCDIGDHTRTWPCDYAPGTGALAPRLDVSA